MTDKSQYGEASIIQRYFGDRKGRFLDLGAFDGITLSNTLPLAERGWTGVLVEPNPLAFGEMMAKYPYPEQVDMVCAGVGLEGGLQPFAVNTPDGRASDMVSTFVPDLEKRWASYGYPFRKIWVSTFAVPLLNKRGPFDFVNVDVEGMNAYVAFSVAHFLYPELLCIEIDDGHENALREGLGDTRRGRGYERFERVGGNLLAWRSR